MDNGDNLPNVVFLVVDSARSYSTGGLDDRDKLDMMDRFAGESVFFSTAVSSAPSSIMAASAILTSLPAYYIARNYDDFKYDDDLFISLPKILKAAGYEIKSVMNALETREKFYNLLPHVSKTYWPQGIKHDQVRWPNSVVNDILDRYLATCDRSRPHFLWVWYNIREDSTTSSELERALALLKKHGLWDNTLLVLCSDHGYIDPRRGYTPELLKARGLTHDLVMTEDNIRIPLYIRFPDSPVKQLDVPVTSLDIMPTILEYLGLGYPTHAPTRMHGLSLLPLINNHQPVPEDFLHRKLRCDARFFAQSDRSTVIRGTRYKYLVRPDQAHEEFYDLVADPWEEHNLISEAELQSEVSAFRAAYRQDEEQAVRFQTAYLISKLNGTIQRALEESGHGIIVVGLGDPYYLDIITSVFREVFGDTPFDLIISTDRASRMTNLTPYRRVFEYTLESAGQAHVASPQDRSDLLRREYSLKLILADTRNEHTFARHRKALEPLIKFKTELAIDPNMQALSRTTAKSNWKFLFQTVYRNRSYYWSNPRIFMRHVRMGVGLLGHRLVTRLSQ